MTKHKPTNAEILKLVREAEVYIDDGTGDLRTVVECALEDDPAATVEDIRRIWAEATADAAEED